MHHQRILFAVALHQFSVANAQGATSDAAAQIVPSDSASSGVAYFGYETLQLTLDSLNNLKTYNESLADLVGFGNATGVGLEQRAARACKAMPVDDAWPSDLTWTLLDTLIGGALIKGIPDAAVCYSDWPQYDAAKCEEVTASWTDAVWQATTPTGIDSPLFEGVTCLPPSYARYNATCTLGGYPSYIVNVTNVAQVQLAVNFARNLNLRLVVKNMGHDFNAKSTGAGALSIWTSHLQDIEYLGDEYAAPSGYKGPAFKLGAGATVGELYEAADENMVQVIGPIARSIGIAGGYIAGGGNSPLISKYGMGADQVISLEVVLPDGRFVSADETTNHDLFYALRGGGGSTWGVVTSVVLRAYEKTITTTLTYTFGTGVEPETFWAAVAAIYGYFQEWPAAGLYTYHSIMCSTATECVFSMAPQFAPNFTTEQLEALNAPFFETLSSLNITVDSLNYTTHNTYLEAFDAMWAPETDGGGTWSEHTGSRLFPRANWEDPAKLNATLAVIRNSSETNGFYLAYNIAPAVNAAVNQTNGVNPAWRETLLFAMLGATWGQNATAEDIAVANKGLTESLGAWREVSPGAGTYLNEADINEPDWQQSFYGEENYAYLYELKQKYDPWGVFYAIGAVGSEEWYVTDQIEWYPTQNGRLCPV